MIVKIGYTYLNYEDGDYYETPLIHSVTTTRPDGSETLYYTYDERGNITSIRRGVNDIVCRYTYDDLGQLIREDNRTLGATYTWTYDNAGNILSSKTYAYTTGSLGSAQRTVSYDYSSGSWGDLLTSNNGRSVTYDNIGNPLRWNDYGELTWQGRRLMSYSDSESGDDYSYTYNADGIRTSKTVNGVKHTYHLSGTQILSEEWTEDRVQHILIFVYDDSGQPIGMSHFQEGTLVDTYLYEKNIQGDVVAVYEYDGDLVVRYAYNAWGAVSETEYGSEYDEESFEVLCNPFRYRGYYYDTDTGFYYVSSRYYDPEIGRWINADSAIGQIGNVQSTNMFSYCFNNPVNMSDPTGNWPKLSTIFAVVAVAAVAVAAVAVTVATCGAAAPALAVAGGGIIGGMSAGAVATAASVATGAMIVAGVSTTGAVTSAVAEKAANKIAKRNNSVYVLKDDAGTVQYVGRTNDVDRRRAAHSANPARAGLEMEVIASGLNLPESRALEQAGMAYYHTINTANKMNNQINSVSPKYWDAFKELALGTLNYGWNQMSNEILYWTGN